MPYEHIPPVAVKYQERGFPPADIGGYESPRGSRPRAQKLETVRMPTIHEIVTPPNYKLKESMENQMSAYEGSALQAQHEQQQSTIRNRRIPGRAQWGGGLQRVDYDPDLVEALVEPEIVSLPTGTTTSLLLDGEIVGHVTYFDWAADNEGYIAGVFRYLMSGAENRPKAGNLYHTLTLAWQTEDNELQPLLTVPNVLIRAELGQITPECAGLEVECRWHNGGPDAD